MFDARVPGPKTPPKHGAPAPVTPPKFGAMVPYVGHVPKVVAPPPRVVDPKQCPHAPGHHLKRHPGARTKALAMLANRPGSSSSMRPLTIEPKAAVCRTFIYVGCPCDGMTIISSIMIDTGHKMVIFRTF